MRCSSNKRLENGFNNNNKDLLKTIKLFLNNNEGNQATHTKHASGSMKNSVLQGEETKYEQYIPKGKATLVKIEKGALDDYIPAAMRCKSGYKVSPSPFALELDYVLKKSMQEDGPSSPRDEEGYSLDWNQEGGCLAELYAVALVSNPTGNAYIGTEDSIIVIPSDISDSKDSKCYLT